MPLEKVREGWAAGETTLVVSSGLICPGGDCPWGEVLAVDPAQNLRSLRKGWEESHSFAVLAALAFF